VVARYLAIIDEADGQFGVIFPDAPGCTAMGRTQEEAIDTAIEALAEWAADEAADGRPIGKPRTYLQVLKSAEFPQLGKGGLIATLPLLYESGKLARANVSMDAGLLAAIDETAAARGLTRSSFLASAARDKLKSSF
jgi:predicted RNase H-like HicB family nuclease